MIWLSRLSPHLIAVRGAPFPVDADNGEVPLAWFLEQGVTPAAIIKVLHPLLMTEADVPRASLPEREAWWLLDELIYRNEVPGPIHHYTAPPKPLTEEHPQFADVWDALWGSPPSVS